MGWLISSYTASHAVVCDIITYFARLSHGFYAVPACWLLSIYVGASHVCCDLTVFVSLFVNDVDLPQCAACFYKATRISVIHNLLEKHTQLYYCFLLPICDSLPRVSHFMLMNCLICPLSDQVGGHTHKTVTEVFLLFSCYLDKLHCLLPGAMNMSGEEISQ